jgi:hypothetical protein
MVLGYFRITLQETFRHRDVLKDRSKSETRIQLDLARRADRREYSPDVISEVTRRVFENGISISAQGERTLRVTRDCKIRMIQQIVSFGVAAGLHLFSNPRKA